MIGGANTAAPCRLCAARPHAPGAEPPGSGLCDGCWEMTSRISRDPSLARQVLAEVDPTIGLIDCHAERIVELRRKLEAVRYVVGLYLVGNWRGLIAYAQGADVLPPYPGADDPATYYAADCRKRREDLVDATFRAALRESEA